MENDTKLNDIYIYKIKLKERWTNAGMSLGLFSDLRRPFFLSLLCETFLLVLQAMI